VVKLLKINRLTPKMGRGEGPRRMVETGRISNTATEGDGVTTVIHALENEQCYGREAALCV